MKKNFTYYYYATKNKKNLVELEKGNSQRNKSNTNILTLLDKVKFSPNKKIVDKIIEYAKNA